MNRPYLAIFACALAAGCHRPPPVDDRPVEPPAPITSATVAPEVAAPLVDLLYRTRSRVAVSSNVANPKDYPEHLIDRRPETAWNGKTGDLDARVLFRVPASTRVRRILITPGYDKVGKDGDLFFMNHRIKRVAIAREGRDVGAFDLDPEDRRPQAIALDEPGGTFELRAIETVPGTKKTWRELVISELSVLGTAPDDELLAPAMPQVTIGGLERRAPEGGPLAAVREAAPFPSVAAFCAQHLAVESKVLARIKARETSVFTDELKPYCAIVTRRTIKDPRLVDPFLKLEIVGLLEGEELVERLVIRTDRGFYPTEVVFAQEYPGPGCGMSGGYMIDAATVEVPRPGAPILRVRVAKRAAYLMAGDPSSFESAATFLIACKLGDGGAPTCTEELTASFDGDGEWTQRTRSAPVFDVHPPRWDWQREASVDDEGHIRLSPCVDAKGVEVACRKRNADLLRRF